MKSLKLPFIYLLLFCFIFVPGPQVGGQNSRNAPLVRQNLNKISLPMDSIPWFILSEKIHAIEKNPEERLTILHIGDSHIQGDFFTGEVRRQLFKYAKTHHPARGIYFPYNLANTNGPDDIWVRSTGAIETGSIRHPGKSYFPVTGYRLFGRDSIYTLMINDSSGYHFNEILIYHSPCKKNTVQVKNASLENNVLLNDSLEVSRFRMASLQHQAILKISDSGAGRLFIYGISFENEHEKICYHSIGINGASFSTILQTRSLVELVSFIHPDCIVLSFGTNDALDRNMRASHEKSQILRIIDLIHQADPEVPVIFTTPGDHLIKKHYPNPRINRLNMIIKETAIRKQCAYWDFYNIMGGNGSVYKWRQNQLFFQDYIHLSKKGYKLQGDLFFEALLALPHQSGRAGH